MSDKNILIGQYQATIGIECHVQLKTLTKLFSGSLNDSTVTKPNSLVNHIDFGIPGSLPVVNEKAIELAIKAGYALNTTAQKFSKFDRKHYFYPDLPMGYQITQFDYPILKGGFMVINLDGETKKIAITKAHLESDAGKSVHPAGANYSLVDLNRAGCPLLEIVSEPEMHSAAEAREYAFELYLAMKFADVSEANLYFGNMRFDVNVSVSQDDNLGTRTETKNLNSFRSIEKAVEYEIKRQIEVLEKGGTIRQETRGWNDAKQIGFVQRVKENSDDYRYMPDPDIPPIMIDEEQLIRIKNSMPVMPNAWRLKLSKLDLDDQQINLLLNAQALLDNNPLGLIDSLMEDISMTKAVVNWIINIELPIVQNIKFENDQAEIKGLSWADQKKLYLEAYELKKANKINSTKISELIEEIIRSGVFKGGLEEYAQKNNYLQNSDQNSLGIMVKDIIEKNPKVVQDIINGEVKAVGFLIGQAMKQSRGQANPQMIQELINQHLNLEGPVV